MHMHGPRPGDLTELRKNMQGKKAAREAKAACGIVSEGAGTSLLE